MCSNFLIMENKVTWLKNVTNKIKIISQNIKNNVCSIFFSLSAFHTQKVATHWKKKSKKKNHANWLKNKKVIQGQKMSKNAQKTPNFYVKKT